MNGRWILVLFGMALIMAGRCDSGWAKDAVQASIKDAPGAVLINENGNPYSVGTYAIGTIQVMYNEVGSAWTPGDFADFQISIAVKEGNPNPVTDYPVAMNFNQTGSSNLQVTVTECSALSDATWDNGSLTLNSSNAQASCTVHVAIQDVDSALNYDGSVLVGNLQMAASGQSHLDTVTTIQVKTMLVAPTACLRLFNMITDFDTTTEVNNLGIKTKRDGVIQNTSPNNLSDTVYLVNICDTDYHVDLQITLDDCFGPASGTKGHSVFFYTSDASGFDAEASIEDLDKSNFVESDYSTQAEMETCIANQLVAANSALLVKVKNRLAMEKESDLPSDNEFTGFSSAVYFPESGCAGDLMSNSEPNAMSLSLPFSVEE